MDELPRFGDKSIGRTPIERIIVWMEGHGILIPVITFLSLVGSVGFNSIVHNEFNKGFVYLIIALISFLRTESARDFLGTSKIALFIAVHMMLFGLNYITLILSLLIFVCLSDRLSKNLLWPFLIYVNIDTFFTWVDIQKEISNIIDLIGHKVFSDYVLGATLILPFTFVYLKLEKYFYDRFNYEFLKKYGILIVLWLLFYFFCIFGALTHQKLIEAIGFFILLFYIMGMLNLKNETLKFIIAMLPVILLFKIVNTIKNLLQ